MGAKDKAKVKAAKARAASLTPSKRKEIARNAAMSRWNEDIPVAEFPGILKFGDMELPCAVLNDETRVLTVSDFMEGMGMYMSGALSVRRGEADAEGARTPLYLAYKNLIPFINKHLGSLHTNPLKYRTKSGAIAHGISAEIIPKICEVWLDARNAGVLGPRQVKIAGNADILIRGLASVGITAMVDEATGFQYLRRKDELEKILTAFISPSLLPWTQRFPMDFYEEMFRLWGWKWDPIRYKTKGPQGPRYAGKLTKILIYDRLPEGVLEKLEEKNPPNLKWQRKSKLFQHLTEDIGNPHVEKLVAIVTTLFRISASKEGFWKHYKRAFPEAFAQQELELEIEGEASNSLPILP